MSHAIASFAQKKMGRALFWTNLLSEPLFTLYGFLVFILYKDLGASSFHIALLTMLKPVITILSFYWSAGLKGQGKKIKHNVLWAGFWMRAPFLLCPLFDSAWFVIGAAVNYMFFYRAAVPGWVEMIKRTTSEEKRGRWFSLSAGLAYAEGVVLALGAGSLLDKDPTLWKLLFMGTALIGLSSLWIQSRLPVPLEEEEEKEEEISWKERIVRPWRDSYELLRTRPDFALFQWGFMVCGFGIMLIQPALPLIVVDSLGISYLEMAGAVSIAKGLGFVLSSPFWGRQMGRASIFRMAALVFLVFALFPLFLTASLGGIALLYVAYFFYGIGQGGSHLVWNLSGPLFSGKEESSRYTGVNVVMAGVRGAVAPPLGSALALAFGPLPVLLSGGALCLLSGIGLLTRSSKQAKKISST